MIKTSGFGAGNPDLISRFATKMDVLLGASVSETLGIAVSGGGDSMAMLTLLHDWSKTRGCPLRAVTVDHGIRAASPGEAAGVAAICQTLGIPHDILTWDGWTGRGNLQSAARKARYDLMANWAGAHEIDHIALGHTQDDQAETVLMRLARGSGVDGLSAMSPVRLANGVKWLRPMLGLSRDELHDYLRSKGMTWVDDPSNDDDRFDRVRIRKALKLLAPLGIDAKHLSETATRMSSARQVLSHTAANAAETLASVRAGAVFLDATSLTSLADETRRRLLNGALCWVSSNPYGPRARALAELWDRLAKGESTTLHGCLILKTKTHVVIAREANAILYETCAPGQIWDQRWRLKGPPEDGQRVALTGANGLKSCENWREIGLPRDVLAAAPAIWQGDDLVASPAAGFHQGWDFEQQPQQNDFIRTLLSH